MGRPTICIGENKGADQLRGDREAAQRLCGENKGADQLRGDREAAQRLCFRYTDSTIPLLPKSEISSFYPSSVSVQPGLCRTWSEPKLLVFSRTGSTENLARVGLLILASHWLSRNPCITLVILRTENNQQGSNQ